MAHHRRSIRIPDFDYSSPGAYFVTICASKAAPDVRAGLKPAPTFGSVENGKMILNDAGRIVERAWRDLPDHYPNIDLDAFVVMPDHAHFIIQIRGPDDIDVRAGLKPAPTSRHPLSEIVRAFKTFSARRINALRGTAGMRVWQRNYFEHIIRDEIEWEQLRAYIEQNPAKWTMRLDPT